MNDLSVAAKALLTVIEHNRGCTVEENEKNAYLFEGPIKELLDAGKIALVYKQEKVHTYRASTDVRLLDQVRLNVPWGSRYYDDNHQPQSADIHFGIVVTTANEKGICKVAIRHLNGESEILDMRSYNFTIAGAAGFVKDPLTQDSSDSEAQSDAN